MKQLRAFWDQNPLAFLLVTGGILRLIAAIFSKGWGMHDDHFLVIEAAQSFVDGEDYNNWLPDDPTTDTPSGHSFFYPGIHFALLWIMEAIGLNSPQGKMFIIRLIHGAYGLLPILLGFKITERVANQKAAKMVGAVLAIGWVFPMLSVRNLVEVVCIVPLMYATWVLIKDNQKYGVGALLIAGLFVGVAMGIRFQTALFALGFGLFFVFRGKIVPAAVFSLAVGLAFSATQLGDIYIWERPFAEFQEYVRYNLEHKTSYFSRPWYMYFLTVGGILIPPISLFWFFGFGRMWRKHLMLFLPAFIFFAFHSYFPNKQERFIFPFVPFFIMLGVIGWKDWLNTSRFWEERKKLLNGFYTWFWVVNSILLIALTPAYSKRNRVESMVWLSEQADFNNMIIESSHKHDFLLPAQYYLDSWKPYFYVTKKRPAEQLRLEIDGAPDALKPNYVVFFEAVELDERIARFETYYGASLQQAAVIEPSYVDAFLHWINPNNDNQTTYIYRIEP